MFLNCRHFGCADKRRITHNVIEFCSRNHGVPVPAERVPFDNVSRRLQRQKIVVDLHDFSGGVHHLAFSNPKRSLSDGYGEIVDFDAVELIDVDLDRGDFAERLLTAVNEPEDVVFQLAEAEIGFGEKVTGTAGGI